MHVRPSRSASSSAERAHARSRPHAWAPTESGNAAQRHARTMGVICATVKSFACARRAARSRPHRRPDAANVAKRARTFCAQTLVEPRSQLGVEARLRKAATLRSDSDMHHSQHIDDGVLWVDLVPPPRPCQKQSKVHVGLTGCMCQIAANAQVQGIMRDCAESASKSKPTSPLGRETVPRARDQSASVLVLHPSLSFLSSSLRAGG